VVGMMGATGKKGREKTHSHHGNRLTSEIRTECKSESVGPCERKE
jgi:hypothetical protein